MFKTKVGLSISFVFVFTFLFSQEMDTIRFGYRTGGEIDSLDFTNAYPLSVFSGGGLNIYNNYLDLENLYSMNGLMNFVSPSPYSKLKFSALPHLGFSYSFGSAGIQFVHFDFQQKINKTLVNLNFNRSSSNGFMRNSAFLKNDFKARIRRDGKYVDINIDAFYNNKDIGLNGGFTNDTFLDLQGLEFLPVLYDNAQSFFKISEFELSNFFHSESDSLLVDKRKIGFQTLHRYNSLSRAFTNDIKLSDYNYDSIATNDQYRYASILNGAGLYLKNKQVFFNVLINHKYWDYQNLGRHLDTSEINLASDLSFKSNKIELSNKFNFNFIGAGKERSNVSHLTFTSSRLSLNLGFDFSQMWPLAFQRRYYSNSYDLKITDYQLQTKIKLNFGGCLSLKNEQAFKFNLESSSLKNNYFFIDSLWRNDTLNSITFHSFNIGGSFHYKHLYINPDLNFNLVSNNLDLMPSFTFNNRLFLKGKLFKAKKMEGIAGLDVAFLSSYKTLNYNPIMDLFYFNNGNEKFKDYTSLSVFFGFEISEFRFYARLENISYSLTDKKNQSVIGYPVQPNFVRLGIVWDFFN